MTKQNILFLINCRLDLPPISNLPQLRDAKLEHNASPVAESQHGCYPRYSNTVDSEDSNKLKPLPPKGAHDHSMQLFIVLVNNIFSQSYSPPVSGLPSRSLLFFCLSFQFSSLPDVAAAAPELNAPITVRTTGNTFPSPLRLWTI